MSFTAKKVLSKFWSTRFLKFATVGASGVCVNLGTLYLVNIVAGVQHNLAAAIAIQFSIVTNFLANELWTFRDHGGGRGGVFSRGMKFQLVALGGAAIQWMTFFVCNLGLAAALRLGTSESIAPPTGYLAALWAAVCQPPDLGGWIFLSQLVGVGVATGWNYSMNVFWTWGVGRSWQR